MGYAVKQFRFYYDNSWTRWLNADELHLIRQLTNIEKAEIIDEMSLEQFNQKFSELALTQ
jgi:hypothetical protein